MQLVPDPVPKDLAETVAQLKEAVDTGHVNGIAFGVSMRGRKYFVHIAGYLARDPTYARGVVAALDDELGRMIHAAADADTTM